MSTLFLICLQNSVVAFVLAVVVWCVTRVWRSSPVAHVLWLLVLVKLLTPPIVPVDVLAWTQLRPVNEQAVVENAILPIPSVDRALPRTAAVPNGNSSESPVAVAPQRVAVADNDDEAVQESRVFLAQLDFMAEYLWDSSVSVLIFIWLAGMALGTCIAVIRISRFRTLVKGMLPAATDWQQMTRELSQRMGLRHVPDVRLAERVHAPLLWCFGRQRVIVVPLRLAQQLDSQQVELVLAHELAHLRRRDHWVRWIELLVTIVYWWYPIIWSVRLRLHRAEEYCCDAWVNWLFPDRVQRYAEVLLFAAESKRPERPVRPVLASPFFQRSYSLKTRIKKILQGFKCHVLSRPARVVVLALALVALPCTALWTFSGGQGAAQAIEGSSQPPLKPTAPPLPYRMAGMVKVKDTNEPVSDAVVRVLFEADKELSATLLNAKTDEKGQYELMVPFGHARTFGVVPPVGYWCEVDQEGFVSSPRHPLKTKDFVVQREPVWQVRLQLPDKPGKLPDAWLSAFKQLENNILSGHCLMDPQSVGKLTIPDVGGLFKLSVGAMDGAFQSVGVVSLNFEKGFRASSVARIDRQGELAWVATDSQGLTATLKGADASLEDDQLTISLPVRVRRPQDFGRLTGTVVNQHGRPVSGARVMVAFFGKASSVGSDLVAMTDAQGRFVIDRFAKLFSDDPEVQKLKLVVTRDGYGCLDTWLFDQNFDGNGNQDVGVIRLKPGHEMRLRIIDHTGVPLAGVSVEPGGSYALRAQATRTDMSGRCVIKNLPYARGVVSLSIQYGKNYAHPEVVLTDKEYTFRMPKPRL